MYHTCTVSYLRVLTPYDTGGAIYSASMLIRHIELLAGVVSISPIGRDASFWVHTVVSLTSYHSTVTGYSARQFIWSGYRCYK